MKDIKKLLEAYIELLEYYQKEANKKSKEDDIDVLWPWLSKEELISHLKISKRTYYNWMKEGYITPCSRVGEDRFLVREINKFIAGKKYVAISV